MPVAFNAWVRGDGNLLIKDSKLINVYESSVLEEAIDAAQKMFIKAGIKSRLTKWYEYN